MVKFRTLTFVILLIASIAALTACSDTVQNGEATSLTLAVTYSQATAINGVEAFIKRGGPDGALITGTDDIEPIGDFADSGRLFPLGVLTGTQVYVLVNCFEGGQLVASDDGDGELITLVAGDNTVSRTCVTHDHSYADVSVTVDTRQAVIFDYFSMVRLSGSYIDIPCDDHSSAAAVDFAIYFTTSVPATTVAAGHQLTGGGIPPTVVSGYTFNWDPAVGPLVRDYWLLAYEEIDGAGEAAHFQVVCDETTNLANLVAPTYMAMPKYWIAPDGFGSLAAVYTDEGLKVIGYAYGSPSDWYSDIDNELTFGDIVEVTPLADVTFTGLWRDNDAARHFMTFVDDTTTDSTVSVINFPYFYFDTHTP